MAGLALKLAPNERVLINGAVIENGPRRTRLVIRSENAAVLRLRDALHMDDVIGPVSQAYYCAQLCVAGEAEPEVAAAELRGRLEGLSKVFESEEHRAPVDAAAGHLRKRDFYRVMRALKDMLDVEREALSFAAERQQVAS